MSNLNEKEYIISITGYSRIFVRPNYFTIDVSMKCVSNSMEQSLNFINGDMASLYRLTDSIGIKKEFVHVVDLNFDLEYEWKKETSVFIGYKVEQKVTIEMDVTAENEATAKLFLIRITEMQRTSNLQQCYISYGLKNKKEHLSKVRELSFLDALKKAEQYAKLAGIKIIGTNTISDIEPVSEYSRSNSNASYECEETTIDSTDDAYLPRGKKIVLENKVFVTFDIGKK